jgi:hypothetical protein
MAYSMLGLQTQGTSQPHSTWWVRDPDGTLISQLERGSDEAHYYVFDGLGSVVALTDSNRNLAARYDSVSNPLIHCRS